MRTLQQHLSLIPDHRKANGKRFAFEAMLEMLVLSGMSGYFGINSISRFIKNNKDFFIDRYQFEQGVPGKTMIFNFLKELDFNALSAALSSWMDEVLGKDLGGQVLNVDGKSIKSTLSDAYSSQQNFVSIVTIYAAELGVVIGSEVLENKKSNEVAAFHALLDKLEFKGAILTFDALYCKKKPRKPSWPQEMAM